MVVDVLKSSVVPAAIGKEEIDRELHRLKQAVEEALEEIDRYARRIESEFDSALAGVFVRMETCCGACLPRVNLNAICASLLPAEAVVRRVLERWYEKFKSLENPLLRQCADDVLDVGRNIIRRLCPALDAGLQSIPEHSILVVERLLPSDVVVLPKANVAAVVVESLGQGSHAALLAREKGIPTITELPGILAQAANGVEILVDGTHGTLVIAPKATTRADFQERLERWRASLVRCKAACREPARTLDGQLIHVEANIGIRATSARLDNGADGVGLLRIEQLYFARKIPPTEDELYGELNDLVTPLANRPVTIRLLDIGGDKPLPYLGLPAESNPVLGRRGVRLLLKYEHLVRTQMGAILRLSEAHRLRVLIPMITIEDDIRRMREAFDAPSAERKIASPPEFGAMVETPAAALAIPALARHVDFFCIGTNDLTQYTLAAARDDAEVNDYYLDGHESILRLLGIILADAKQRPVTLCGELAGRESFVPHLLQMGFRGLSVALALVPPTKAAIRKVDIGARHAMESNGE